MNAAANTAESLFADYTTLIQRCDHEQVDDNTVRELLSKAKAYIEQLKTSNRLPSEELRDLCAHPRYSAATLLLRAPWLEVSTRSLITDFISSQPEFIDDRYHFTLNLMRQHIPVWEKVVGTFAGKPDLQFLEIGSYEGQSACWLLENILTHPGSRLTCIDLFEVPGKEQGHFDASTDSFNMSFYQRFLYNLSLTQAAHRVRIIAENSARALRSLLPDFYDFIYVDGSHLAKDVIRDALLSWDLLKRDGIVIFDDYKWQSPQDSGALASPKIAIDSFLRIFEGDYKVLFHDYQVICQKTAYALK